MTARERILAIRIMEKLWEHPAYAEVLGVSVSGAVKDIEVSKGEEKYA